MTIIIATGGTGGHFFPALEVASELKRKGHSVIFVGPVQFGKLLLTERGIAYHDIDVGGLVGRGPVQFLVAGVKMLKGIIQAHMIFGKVKPDAVLGFGGYGSCPAVIAACLRGCPAVIHEQNVIPGKANQLLAHFIDKIAISFKESLAYFPKNKTVVTGYPVRAGKSALSRDELYQKFKLDPNRETILVFGGSQGSRKINTTFIQMLLHMDVHELNKLQVIHLTGKNEFDECALLYSQIRMPSYVVPFYLQMDELYKITDLVISRSGAGTVSEVALYQCPAIFIPYPFAGGHQLENAAVLKGSRMVSIIEERELTREALEQRVYALLSQAPADDNDQASLSAVVHANACEKIAEEVLSV